MIVEEIIEKFAEAVKEVSYIKKMEYGENLVMASGCNQYGCTCISHERCCGCFIQ